LGIARLHEDGSRTFAHIDLVFHPHDYGAAVDIPVNLQTNPSPEDMLEMMPPLATRSSTYLQFQATRWPLSMMYFSLFWS
jgi:hypothetical protein